MKRFHFAFRALVAVRAHRETRALEAFGAAIRRCVAAEQDVTAARRQLENIAAAVLAGRRGHFRANAAASSVLGYQREQGAVVAAEKALAAARAEMQQRRLEYLEARRGAEALRRLEKKARDAHLAEGRREEQAMFDELSASRFARAGRPAPSAAELSP